MHFISINLSLNPTDEELRKAREICALMRSMSSGTDPNRGADDGEPPTVPVKNLTPPPPGGAGEPATFQPPGNPDAAPSRDATGLPWDARIHSSTKGVNQDGSWKKRRGVQDAEVTRIEAEIRATLSDATPAIPPPATFQTQVAPPVPPPPSVAPPAPPPAPATAGVNSFIAFLGRMTAAIAAKQMVVADSAVVCQALGIAGLPLLAQRVDLLPIVEMYVDQRIAGASHADALAMVKAMAGV